MPIKAVIFDMDGVLINSEPYYYEYLNQRFDKLGLSVTSEEYNGFVGLPSNKVWSYLETTRGITLGIEDLMKNEEEQINHIFSQAHLEPIEGVRDLMLKLNSLQIPMSVASSSYKSTIELIIKKLGLQKFFEFLVSGTEVKKGKPHPDIFLKSAKLHNVLPQECLVIEDSTNGLTGARKAGMFCVGFKNPGSGQQDLSQAQVIIEDYRKDSIQAFIHMVENSQ